MKRIGFVLSVLLVYFFIKFSQGNLSTGSFFLKVGCLADNKEYSLFVETGTNLPKTVEKTSRIAVYEPLPTPSKPQPLPMIQPVAITPVIREENPEEEAFALAVEEMEEERLKLEQALQMAHKKILEEAVSRIAFEVEEYKEIDLQTETAFGDLPLEHILPQLPTFSEIAHVEVDQEGLYFSEAPSTEQEFAAAEIAVRNLENEEIRYLFSEYPTEISPILFGDAVIADPLSPYTDLPNPESIHIVTLPIQVDPEFEIANASDAPTTEREFAAAEAEVRSFELAETKYAFSYEAEELKMLPFGDMAINDPCAPYSDASTAESIQLVSREIQIDTEFEIASFNEAPTTEREFAAAETEVRSKELAETKYAFSYEAEELKAPPFGDMAINDPFAPYSDAPVNDSIQLVSREIQVDAEFEIASFNEAPTTERELAAAEAEVRSRELAEPKCAFFDDSQELAPIHFGDTAIADKADPYTEVIYLETKISVQEIAAHPDLAPHEIGNFQEVPDTEQELAAAESDVRSIEIPIEIAVGEMEEPLKAMGFGETAIGDRFTPYAEVVYPESKIAVQPIEEQVEFAQFESTGFEEVPNIEKELAAAESDVRSVERPIELAIGKVEEPLGIESGFGETSIGDKVDPYAEFISSEIAVKETELPFEFIQFESGGYQEAPNTEKELAAAEADARRVEMPVERAIANIEEPKVGQNAMAFGEASIGDKVAPYAELSYEEPQIELVVKEVEPQLEFAQFEIGGFQEAPNTEKELAGAESEVRKIELPIERAIGMIEEPKEEIQILSCGKPMIAETLAPYPEALLPETKTDFMVKEVQTDVEKIASEFESKGYKEAPNVEKEFAAAESEVKKAEAEAKKTPEKNEAPPRVEIADAHSSEETRRIQVEQENIASMPADTEPLPSSPSWLEKWTQSKWGTPLDEEKHGSYLADQYRPSSPFVKWISAQHTWGSQEKKCIPFATNYTTLEFFLSPDYRLGHVMPILDLRGHRFDNNTYAANGGIGGRYIPNPKRDRFCELLGFNFYYDYRQGCIGYFNQVGAGIEVLGKRWDLRANVYVPFGKKRHLESYLFDDYEGDYWAIQENIESISYSFNGEIGCLLIKDFYKYSLYAAAGPYFIARAVCNDGVVGAEARIRPQYKDYVAVDLSWRYDQLFETIWQVEVIFTLPLYQIANQNKRPCGITDRQIYQPIQRFEVMPLSKRTCWYTNF